MGDTEDVLIAIDTIESILKDEETYMNFLKRKGEFADIEVKDYLEAINNYMKYIVKHTSEEDESLFIRANKINKKYKTGVSFSYLLYVFNTDIIISIGTIESILNDDEIFNKFLNFRENTDYFGKHLISYLASIWQYVYYMSSRKIALSSKASDHFNQIVREFSLDYKRAYVLSGEYIEEDMNEEFLQSILDSVDLTRSPFNVSLDLYKELCKRCSYDPLFFALDQDMNNPVAADIYNKSASTVNKSDSKVVCRTWAVMYQDLLTRCGIRAKVDGKFHKYVIFDCDGTLMKADGTNCFFGRKDEFYLNDLIRCKIGLPVSGFVCLEKDKDIEKFLDENEQFIIENSNELTILSQEYREKFMNKRALSFDKNFALLNSKVKKSKLTNFDLTKYIDVLYRILLGPFNNIKKGSNYIVINDDNEVIASYLISYVNDSGEYCYYLFEPNNGFVNIKQEEIIELIDSKKMYVVGAKQNILGIEEELENGYVK